MIDLSLRRTSLKHLLLWAFFWIILSVSAQQDFRVYVFVAEECPISIAMAAPLNEVSEQYARRAKFIAVFPNLKSDEISMRAFLARHQMKAFQPILDSRQALTRELGARVTPEVVVVDASERVVYRGRITDAYSAPGRVRHGKAKNDLEAALARLTSGHQAPAPWPEAIGCFITFLPRAE